MVRCKFKVSCITNYDGGTTGITLAPVCSGCEENKAFWKYTPSGKIEFSTINTEATKQFEVGKEFYVDFTPAD